MHSSDRRHLWDRDEVLARCLAEEVPVGQVNSIADVFADEHFRARGNLARVDDPEHGPVVVPGVVPTLSATPGRIGHLGPRLGASTDAVLGELLGIAAGEIARLREQHIV